MTAGLGACICMQFQYPSVKFGLLVTVCINTVTMPLVELKVSMYPVCVEAKLGG